MQRRTLIATVTTAGLLALTGGAAFAQAGGGLVRRRPAGHVE